MSKTSLSNNRILLCIVTSLYLRPSSEKLEVRQGEGGNHVPGLQCMEVCGMDDIEFHLSRADKNRSQTSTNMNEHSSRSHMLLTIYITSQNLITGVSAKGKLNLVFYLPLYPTRNDTIIWFHMLGRLGRIGACEQIRRPGSGHERSAKY